MARSITARELKDALYGTGEIALVDVRPEAVYGANHILLASNVPLGHLELRIADLVPRPGTPVVLCDGGEGLAETAAAKLAGFGYSDISILEGGVNAWGAAGLELFSGLYVPSKAFGEFVEHEYETPSVSAEELKGMMDAGEDMVVLDSRPMGEFTMMNIPTGIDMPGAELVYRVQEAAPRPETTIVVNCAGRTRSIIGAQSLINAGVPNKIVALRNGTMGWHLAGYKLEHGNMRPPPEVSADGAGMARRRSRTAADRFGVRHIDLATLDKWRAERDRTTLYVFDVRTAEEFAAGHLVDSRHAPGGQLVQSTDAYMATQRARVVLVDPEMVRAEMTGSWLRQLGWEDVFVLEGGLDGAELKQGARPAALAGTLPDCDLIPPAEAKARVDAGALFLDLTRSLDYRDNHAEGARWCPREKLGDALGKTGSESAILIAGDERLARLAATDLASKGLSATVVSGGTEAWEASGLPMAAGMGEPLAVPDDVYMRPYDKEAGREEMERRMNAYLTWEIALVDQIARDGGISFRSYR
ncbi:rhodanese-like domain-containing protein [Nisaea acidiphila]|uniref:Rhodanese-like domain-containing protein n=1 Tax=Nisaea acidiphila TaxID=1862145 RepID=A0A9J7AS17_9PROT|nr:rhodanese-like domain-containing protein [Nisaea acidiphila]UUX50055.1 rhodanese-like domain-containing protein [Nisaea acidiphila]